MTERLKTDVELVKEDVHVVSMEADNVKHEVVTNDFENVEQEAREVKDEVKDSLNAAELEYERRKEVLKDHLATFYANRYSTIPWSRLLEEYDTPLDFYILPEMNFIEKNNKRPFGEETKTPVKSLSDVFMSENSCEIYLTADAGFGKTSFSKYLALTWCQAHRPKMEYRKYFSEDAIHAMRDFEFLFLVLLRDSFDDCSIDDMIVNQVIQNLPRSSAMTIDSLNEILHRERCLVILDGLDEWVHPETKCGKVPKMIPHRNVREKRVTLTTTKPWKLGVLNLKTSEIDKKVELVKLTSESAQILEERAISKLKNLDVAEAKFLAKQLNKTIKENKLEDLESVPLLTIYLISLWCNDIPLGQSKCGLYASIIELLLSRTISRRPEMKLTFEPSQSDIPQCFSEHEHCTKYCTYLNALGQLAFKTLFSETMESTLVFNQSVADKYLSPNYLKLSLDSGILTQSTEKTVIKIFYKCSFSHKTVQEFLCALYISCQNESDIKNIVLKKCKSLQSILDMSTVFVFVSGMNEEIMSSVSREWISVISEDKITGAYRSTADYDVYEEHPLKDIQDMYISCIKENTSDKELKLFCQDFFFSGDCKEENYLSNLTRLAADNRGNIETINIDTRHGPSLREVIDKCALFELFNISKVYFYGKGEDAILLLPVLMNRSSKCVTVRLPFPLRGSWTREMSKTLQNNSLLQAIYIDCFMMSHDVLNDFLNYMINRKSMKEIKLSNIFCAEHRTSCGAEFKLDFSQHSDLRTLALHDIPVSQVKVNASLEDYHIGRVNSGLMTSYLRNLPAASQLQTFACGYQKSSGDVASMLQTLQSLVEVKHIALYDSNLEGRILSPKMVIIELVLLDNVTMPASTFRDLVKVVEKLSHQVKVKIYTSIIEPRTEFEDIKQYIYSSEYFRVLHYDNRGNFVFETEVESHITD